MSQPFWKDLVDKVREEKEDHLEPVREVIEWRLPRASVERELLEEIAGSLGRAVAKVNAAIERAVTLEARADEGPEREAAFEAARLAALRARRDLEIHREALHLPRDPDFVARYPVPEPRPRRRS